MSKSVHVLVKQTCYKTRYATTTTTTTTSTTTILSLRGFSGFNELPTAQKWPANGQTFLLVKQKLQCQAIPFYTECDVKALGDRTTPNPGGSLQCSPDTIACLSQNPFSASALGAGLKLRPFTSRIRTPLVKVWLCVRPCTLRVTTANTHMRV